MWIQAAKKKKVVVQLTIKSVSGLLIFFFLFSTTSKKKQLYHINALEPFRFSLEKKWTYFFDNISYTPSAKNHVRMKKKITRNQDGQKPHGHTCFM